MTVDLSGARVLVTGASRGIGRGLATAFAEAGATPLVVARSAEALAEVAERTDGRAYPTDLADPEQVDALATRLVDDGGVDVLVNNAAVSHVGDFLATDPAAMDQILRVNLHAPVRLAHALLPGMLERRRGRIVNVSSLAAVISTPGLVTYSASKAGLSHFSSTLRLELRGLPVGVTLVHLGSVPTGLDDRSREHPPIRAIVERSSGRDITPLDEVVRAIVDAVRQERDHVRLPRMAAALPALVEAPRRLSELLWRNAPVRASTPP